MQSWHVIIGAIILVLATVWVSKNYPGVFSWIPLIGSGSAGS